MTIKTAQRSLRTIARSILAQCRRDDIVEQDALNLSAADAVRGWRDGAAQAGDTPIVAAIDYLGSEAADAYMARGGRSPTTSECDRIEKHWRRTH